jgi:hypothetical protein
MCDRYSPLRFGLRASAGHKEMLMPIQGESDSKEMAASKQSKSQQKSASIVSKCEAVCQEQLSASRLSH